MVVPESSYLARHGPWRRVAVVRASRVGDFVCATPSLRTLRNAVPDAEITLVGLPMIRELAERLPYVDRFVPFPGFPGMAEQFFRATTATRFLADAQAHAYDLALQLHGSGVYSNPFTLLMGARHTVGFVRPDHDEGLLDVQVTFPESGLETDRMLALLREVGATVSSNRPEIRLTDDDRAHAWEITRGFPRPLVAIHPGGMEPEKRWSVQGFGEAARRIQGSVGGTVVGLGNQAERGLSREVGDCLSGPFLNLAGRTTLATVAALIGHADILLANDSGLAHLAYAIARPSVTLFLATDPARWGPPEDGPHLVLSQNDVSLRNVVDSVVGMLQPPVTSVYTEERELREVAS